MPLSKMYQWRIAQWLSYRWHTQERCCVWPAPQDYSTRVSGLWKVWWAVYVSRVPIDKTQLELIPLVQTTIKRQCWAGLQMLGRSTTILFKTPLTCPFGKTGKISSFVLTSSTTLYLFFPPGNSVKMASGTGLGCWEQPGLLSASMLILQLQRVEIAVHAYIQLKCGSATESFIPHVYVFRLYSKPTWRSWTCSPRLPALSLLPSYCPWFSRSQGRAVDLRLCASHRRAGTFRALFEPWLLV